MPTPEQMAAQQRQMPPEMLSAFRPQGEMRAGDRVADELAALREEVAALRSLLSPPSAVVLTGPHVLRQFDMLRRVSKLNSFRELNDLLPDVRSLIDELSRDEA